MNALFVNIKVDREERPDIDALYMNALHLLGEQGGWPLTMFLTPKGEPFWGGTYFPPEPRYGRPSFRQVLQGVAAAYRAEDGKVMGNVAALRGALARMAAAAPGPLPDAATLEKVALGLVRATDAEEGGLLRRAEIPEPADLPLPVADALPPRPAGLRGGRRAAAPAHEPGRHLRPSRRRLRALQRGCDLAGAAFREDALRQRADPRTARLCPRRAARSALRAAGGGDGGVARARDARGGGRRRLRLQPGRRQRGRGRPVLRLVGRGGGRAARPGEPALQRDLRRGRGGQLGRPHDPEPAPAARDAGGGRRGDARAPPRHAVRGAREAHPARARRQGARRLERAGDRGAGPRRRGVRPPGVARTRPGAPSTPSRGAWRRRTGG